jgi:hypothetical protein
VKCLIKGKPQYIPYFILLGIVGMAGMLIGFKEIMCESMRGK